MDIKRATDLTVLSHALVLVGLSLSGAISGTLSEILYISAFLLPTAIALFVGSKFGARPIPLGIKKAALPITLLSVFPTVLVILTVSILTSLVLKFTGIESEVTLYETLGENLLRHALLPAFLEEAVFRYLPMSLYGKEGARECILVSSLSFALIHCSFFQIPYALIAGFIFITLNYAAKSPLPSLILHTVNNAVSVLSLYYATDLPIILTVAVLAAISLVFIIRRRKEYRELIKEVFGEKRKLSLSISLLIIIIPTLFVATLYLF